MGQIALTAIKGVIFGWLGKMASKKFIEWVLVSAAEEYVKSTKTKADDKWLDGFKKYILGEKQ